MQTDSEAGRGKLDKEQVALALQNVSHIFGDEAGGGSAQGLNPKLHDHSDHSSRAARSGSHASSFQGRGRVDSSARPAQFMQKGVRGLAPNPRREGRGARQRRRAALDGQSARADWPSLLVRAWRPACRRCRTAARHGESLE
jgi:hypothetical protein